MDDEFGTNGALRIRMGPVVLTEQEASEKALRRAALTLRTTPSMGRPYSDRSP